MTTKAEDTELILWVGLLAPVTLIPLFRAFFESHRVVNPSKLTAEALLQRPPYAHRIPSYVGVYEGFFWSSMAFCLATLASGRLPPPILTFVPEQVLKKPNAKELLLTLTTGGALLISIALVLQILLVGIHVKLHTLSIQSTINRLYSADSREQWFLSIANRLRNSLLAAYCLGFAWPLTALAIYIALIQGMAPLASASPLNVAP